MVKKIASDISRANIRYAQSFLQCKSFGWEFSGRFLQLSLVWALILLDRTYLWAQLKRKQDCAVTDRQVTMEWMSGCARSILIRDTGRRRREDKISGDTARLSGVGPESILWLLLATNMENRNCYDEIVGHKRAGQSLLPDAFAHTHKPRHIQGPNWSWSKILLPTDNIKLGPYAAAARMCRQWHRFQHLFEAKTNLTNLYLRVARVLLPNLSHSWAECFHESLVLEVEQVEFLRHPICPAWASCLFCRAIKARVVFFESFSISFQTLVVYLPDVCVSVNLVQRKSWLKNGAC